LKDQLRSLYDTIEAGNSAEDADNIGGKGITDGSEAGEHHVDALLSSSLGGENEEKVEVKRGWEVCKKWL
jgi:hypothetical protein